MEVFTTTEKHITIRSAEPLSETILATELSADLRLGDFLVSRCTPLATGACELYLTTACSHFTRLRENRDINEAHVSALMESFKEDGYLFTVLYVNERLEIIDGQHRFEAARRFGLPVYFMVMPGWGIREVSILNMNSKNWTVTDFMETHAKAGNPNYVRFKEFFDANEFDITTCQLIVLGRRSRGYAASDSFRLGQMQVDEQQIESAWLKANRIAELRPYHPQGWKSRTLVEAMLALFGTHGYDHSHLVAKLRTYPDILLLGAKSLRTDEYLKILTDKYNFRRLKGKIEVPRQ